MSSKESQEALFAKIDALLGSPEDEDPQEREKRHQAALEAAQRSRKRREAIQGTKSRFAP